MNINIKNPLLCDGNMRRIIESYFKTSTLEHFKVSIKNHVYFKNYKESSKEKYAVKQFVDVLQDYWKAQIINCNTDKFPYEKYKINESDLIYLKGYLISEAQSNKEESDMKIVQSKRLYEILDKFTYLNKNVDYKNINSYDFYIDQIIDLDSEFIVTLNIKSREVLFKLLTQYVKVCLEDKRTFNFKFSPKLNNDNTIIIYTDKNNLEKTINTLTNIRKNNKELDAELSDIAKEPPLLYGIVDEWIGVRQIDDKFYDDRINCLYESLNLVVSNWYDNLLDKKNSQYTGMTYKDVLEDEIRSFFEYELKYLNISNTKEYFARKRLDIFIKDLLSIKYEDLDEYQFRVFKDCTIRITKGDINRRLYKIMGEIYRNDKSLVEEIRNAIVMYSKKYNIDYNNFYLDNKASEYLFKQYEDINLIDFEEYLLEYEQPKEKVLNRKI